jgi:hypothetical protein
LALADRQQGQIPLTRLHDHFHHIHILRLQILRSTMQVRGTDTERGRMLLRPDLHMRAKLRLPRFLRVPGSTRRCEVICTK